MKEYAAGKPTDSGFKKYLTICAYFREVKDVKAIGIQHIYTCFKLLSWSVPNDLDKPFANLAAAKKLDRAGNALFSINLLGLNDLASKGD